MMSTFDAAWGRRIGHVARGKSGPSLLDTAGSLAAIAVLVLSVASSALEQSATDPTHDRSRTDKAHASTLAPPTREFMVGAYGGAPYTYASDVTVRKTGVHDFTVKDVSRDGAPFKNPIYYGARVVHWFEGGRTGAMVDFTHSKTLARLSEEALFHGALDGKPAPERSKIGDVFRRLEASHGHNMLTLNGLLRLPALGLRFHPYVGVGLGVALPHSEVQMIKDPRRTYEYQYTGPVVQALFGIEFRLPRMSYFAEYKFTLADYQMPLTQQDGSILFLDLWRQFQRWWKDNEPPGGWLSTRLTSHQAIVGLGVRFGGTPAAP